MDSKRADGWRVTGNASLIPKVRFADHTLRIVLRDLARTNRRLD